MRTQEQIAKIKEKQSPPVQLWNVLTQQKINELINHYEKSEKTEKNTGPIVSYVKEGEGVIDDILTILRNTFGDFKVRTAHFFDVSRPHIIHIDDDFEYPNSYKAFTIPLEIRGCEENKAKLIFFDQYYYGGPAKFVKNTDTDGKPQYYNSFVTEYDDIENTVDIEMSEEHKKLITHLWDDWPKGLSIQKYFPWHIGSIIAFDSLQLHCASDFLSTGATSKLGLSIFTTID